MSNMCTTLQWFNLLDLPPPTAPMLKRKPLCLLILGILKIFKELLPSFIEIGVRYSEKGSHILSYFC